MKQKKGSGSFNKLPNGTFEFTISVGNDIYGKRQRKKFYGKTEAECRKKYNEFIKGGEKPVTKEHTLSTWLDVWLTTYKQDKVSEGTYDDYVGLAAHVKKHKMGGMKLSAVKPIHVTGFFGEKSKYSHSFHKRMRFLLNGAFETAIDNDFCAKNPVRRAEIPKKVPPQKEAFAETDMQTIIEFAKSDKLFGLAIYIMFNSGIRSQEMRALTIDKIDLAKGVITVDSAVKRNGKLGLPKNNRSRYIPLEPEVVEFIAANLDADTRYIIGGDDYVSKEGFRSRYKWFFDRLNKHLAETGKEQIEAKSPHSARHSTATYWQKNGMPIAMVAALLGHHSTDVTDKYTHLDDVGTLSQAVKQYGFAGNKKLLA